MLWFKKYFAQIGVFDLNCCLFVVLHTLKMSLFSFFKSYHPRYNMAGLKSHDLYLQSPRWRAENIPLCRPRHSLRLQKSLRLANSGAHLSRSFCKIESSKNVSPKTMMVSESVATAQARARGSGRGVPSCHWMGPLDPKITGTGSAVLGATAAPASWSSSSSSSSPAADAASAADTGFSVAKTMARQFSKSK
jgi:hypothetical protein